MAKTRLPIIEQRRIEANVIKPIYEQMKASLGEEQAKQILASAIRNDSISQGQAYAADLPVEQTGLHGFHSLLPQWTANGALEVEPLAESENEVSYNVTRCRYAEMYQEMGLAEIGHILSCGRDGTFCTGFNPKIKLTRTQTIMQGASHCDFRYYWNEKE